MCDTSADAITQSLVDPENSLFHIQAFAKLFQHWEIYFLHLACRRTDRWKHATKTGEAVRGWKAIFGTFFTLRDEYNYSIF